MFTRKLKNGKKFKVGDKTYRVIDDELYEVRQVKVSSAFEIPVDVPCYPIDSPALNWPENTDGPLFRITYTS